MPAELQPHVELWLAAIRLLIEDAHRAAHRGHQAGPEAVEALGDVLTCGPILRRLCKPIAVDPEVITRAVQIELRLREAA